VLCECGGVLCDVNMCECSVKCLKVLYECVGV